MSKGLDNSFIHYGIRKQDMNIIAELCQKHEIDFDWLQEEILKPFHEKKVSPEEFKAEDVEKLISKALQKIK